MADGSDKPVLVSFAELVGAYDFVSFGIRYENEAFIDAETGEIYLRSVSAGMDEVLEEFQESENLIPVSHKNDLELGRNLVMSFLEKELPNDWDTVSNIFSREGAYRRFRQLLESRDLLEKRYAFEAAATEEALRAWCEAEGIQFTDPEQA